MYSHTHTHTHPYIHTYIQLTEVGDFVKEDELLAEIETDKVKYIHQLYHSLLSYMHIRCTCNRHLVDTAGFITSAMKCSIKYYNRGREQHEPIVGTYECMTFWQKDARQYSLNY